MGLGSIFFLTFLGVIALAIVKSVIGRKLNPYGEVAYAGLPDPLRSELERVLPGFRQELARMTKKGDEARLEGEYQGAQVRIEADFDKNGNLLEFEVDGPRAERRRDPDGPTELPAAAAEEIDRVLGEDKPRFERYSLSSGTAGTDTYFKVKGNAGEWKWEIVVTSDGRLLEVEKEQRHSGR